MNRAMANALCEELEKISTIGAAARGLAQGVRHGIAAEATKSFRQLSGKTPGARTMRSNVTDAVKSFASPVKSFQRGMRFVKRDSRNALGKALLVGGTAMGLPTVLAKHDPTGENRSHLRRGLEFAGGEIGGIMGSPFGLSGAMTASTIGSVMGNRAGALVDRMRGYGRPAPAMLQQPAPGGA